MPFKLSSTLRETLSASGVAPTLRRYEHHFRTAKGDESENGQGNYKEINYKEINNLYYDLATDFFEFGWGKSFHFAPRVPGESFQASLARHEHYLAHILSLRPGMLVADLGCGVGGPLMEIARFSGAKIVGININAYQLERARKLTADAGLEHLAEFLHCDFLDVDAPDESFDAIYSIEAACCAPDKPSIYGEAFRLLKPGTQFAAYEFCLTDRFDASDPRHLKIKADIELGGGLLDIDYEPTVDDALQAVGFEILQTRDLAVQTGPSIPWYQSLAGSGLSLAGLRRSTIGRWGTHNLLRGFEALRLAPNGSANVAETLNLCADAMVEAGRLGIFTPMYFIHARKPA